jgi:hypothetical protein
MLVAQAFNWMLDAEGDEQCWADARLIACAPELLEALRQIAKIGNQPYGTDYEEIDEAREIAQAAITKAEGELK